MDILTNTISLLFRPRQKEIAKFAQDADAIQHKQLKSLLSTARNTEWGLKYDYKSIQGYADFCERIPLQTYDDIKPYVTRMINGEKNILWPSVVRWYAKAAAHKRQKQVPSRHTRNSERVSLQRRFRHRFHLFTELSRQSFFCRQRVDIGRKPQPFPFEPECTLRGPFRRPVTESEPSCQPDPRPRQKDYPDG